MARFRGKTLLAGQGGAYQDLDCDIDNVATPEPGAAGSYTPYDWNKVLASGRDCVAEGEVEINRMILQRLQDDTAPQQEVLASILDTYLDRVVDTDLWVLCTVSIAGHLGLVEDIVTSQRQEMVHGCIERALPKRLHLNKERAETFLQANWGGWDVCRLTRNYSPTVIVELAKLCRLGVGKEKAKTLLQQQISKRRIGKTPGLRKEPALRKRDVTMAIAQITDELNRPRPPHQSNPSKSHKRERGEDSAYVGPRRKRPALKVVTSSNTSVNNVLPSADPEPEVEVGRGRTDNLGDIEGASSDSLGGLDASCSPEEPHSTAPTSLPVTPSSPCKPHTRSPQPPLGSLSLLVKSSLGERTPVDQSLNDTLEYSCTPDQPPVQNDDYNFDLLPNRPEPHQLYLSRPTIEANLLRSGHQSHCLRPSPPVNNEDTLQITEPPEFDGKISEQAGRSGEPSHVSAQALQELKDGQRLAASVINAVLEKLVSMSDIFLVDSSELAKFDRTSQWNTDGQNGMDPVDLSMPRGNRRLRALSAPRLIMPFHHPHKEHWSLFVASRTEDSYAIQHYDSLWPESRDVSADSDDIVRGYLHWLTARGGERIEVMPKFHVKDCVAQRDGVNCGIHLLANAEAVIENRDVPATIDTNALRRKYWNLLRPAVHEPSISTSPLPIDPPPSFLPPSLTGRQAADSVMEYAIAHDPTDEVPTDGINPSPPTDDVTGHASAETAMDSSSRVGIAARTRIDATGQASAGSAIATASPSDRSTDRKSPAIVASATAVLSTQSKSISMLDTPPDQSQGVSTRETDPPDLKSVQETQRLQAHAGYAQWNDLLEAASRDLEVLESQALELQRHGQSLSEKRQEASTRESVWQSNFENLERVPWETLPKGSSCDGDPSLDNFRAGIRQRAATAREEKTRLGQEIDQCNSRQRELGELIGRATALVKGHREKKESWQSYVKHLNDFMI